MLLLLLLVRRERLLAVDRILIEVDLHDVLRDHVLLLGQGSIFGASADVRQEATRAQGGVCLVAEGAVSLLWVSPSQLSARLGPEYVDQLLALEERALRVALRAPHSHSSPAWPTADARHYPHLTSALGCASTTARRASRRCLTLNPNPNPKP